MAFFKYTGPSGYLYSQYDITAVNGLIYDFGASTPPSDGRWASDPGPATGVPDNQQVVFPPGTPPSSTSPTALSWAATTFYAAGQLVVAPNEELFYCAVSHTSGASFYADVLAGKWQGGRRTLGVPSWNAAWSSALHTKANPVVVVAGMSLAQGQFASGAAFGNCWPQLLRARLQAAYGDGGSGFATSANVYLSTAGAYQPYSTYNVAGSPTVDNIANWFHTAALDGPGGAVLNNFTGAGTGTAGTATFVVRGTTVLVLYKKYGSSGGSVSWTIDGAAQTALNTVSGGALTGIGIATVNGLSSGNHTVVFSPGTGVRFGVYGVAGQNATGVTLHNMARSGMTSQEMAGQLGAQTVFIWNNATSYPLNSIVYYTPAAGVYTANQTGYYKATTATTIGNNPVANAPNQWVPLHMSAVPNSFASWTGGSNLTCDLLIVETGGNDCLPLAFYGNAPTPPDVFIDNTRLFLDGILESYGAGTPPSILLVSPAIGNFEQQVSSTGGARPFGAYASRLEAFAREIGAGYVPMWPLTRGSKAYGQALGYWGNHLGPVGSAGDGTDNPHMSDAGHAAMANMLYPLIAA